MTHEQKYPLDDTILGMESEQKYGKDDHNADTPLSRLDSLVEGVRVMLGFDTEARLRSDGSDAVVLRPQEMGYSNEEELRINIKFPRNNERLS